MNAARRIARPSVGPNRGRPMGKNTDAISLAVRREGERRGGLTRDDNLMMGAPTGGRIIDETDV